AVDSKLRFSSTICHVVKRVNDCFDITGRIRFRLNKIKDSKTVQKISTKLLRLTKTGLDAFDQISKETKQVLKLLYFHHLLFLLFFFFFLCIQLVSEKEVELSTCEEKQEETAGQHTDDTSEASDHAGQKMMVMDDEGDKIEETIQPFSSALKT
ncbi:hypothetical protein RFI_09227, partial [Reticulomyxa filosa]